MFEYEDIEGFFISSLDKVGASKGFKDIGKLCLLWRAEAAGIEFPTKEAEEIEQEALKWLD